MESHKKNSSNLRFNCPICNASYGRHFALKDHLREKHAEIEMEDELIEFNQKASTATPDASGMEEMGFDEGNFIIGSEDVEEEPNYQIVILDDFTTFEAE